MGIQAQSTRQRRTESRALTKCTVRCRWGAWFTVHNVSSPTRSRCSIVVKGQWYSCMHIPQEAHTFFHLRNIYWTCTHHGHCCGRLPWTNYPCGTFSAGSHGHGQAQAWLSPSAWAPNGVDGLLAPFTGDEHPIGLHCPASRTEAHGGSIPARPCAQPPHTDTRIGKVIPLETVNAQVMIDPDSWARFQEQTLGREPPAAPRIQPNTSSMCGVTPRIGDPPFETPRARAPPRTQI